MRVERLPIDTFSPAIYNPRKDLLPGDREWVEIERSLDEFGLVEPLIGNASTGNLVGGHQRLKILKARGETHAEFSVITEPDERREKALNVRLNGSQGAWDWEALHELLRDDPTLAELAGFASVDLDALEHLAGSSAPAGLYAQLDVRTSEPAASETGADDPGPDHDRKEELRVEYGVELGQVWRCGRHRLICGDSTTAEVIDQAIEGDPVDCVLTDPPYAIYGSSTGLGSSVTDDKMVRPFFRDTLMRCEAATRLFAQVYVFCDWRSWPSWWEVAKATRLEPKNLLVWDKGGSGLGNNWANTYELVGFFTNMPRQKTMQHRRTAGQRAVLHANIIRANRPSGKTRSHNAQKPTDLLAEILNHATLAGERVLDPYVGSGSTLVACEQTERAGVAVDVDPGWIAVTLDRLARMGLSIERLSETT
jgi:DNA modification methylase